MMTRASLAGAMSCALVPLMTAAAGADEPPAPPGPDHGLAIRPGAWSYFADPRALHYAGADNAGWATMDGKIQVVRLNGKTITVDTMAGHLRPDDHSSPALAPLPGGPLAAFWSPHVPPGTPDAMYYRVRRRGKWSPRRSIPTNSNGQNGYTYPNPVRVGKRMMLFWRGGNYQPTYSATHDGRTWSAARTLLTGPQIGDNPRRRERPYAKYFAARGIVHMAYNESHPSRRHTSLYYLRMRGSRLVDAGNQVLGRRPLRWDQGSLIYSGAQGSAWVMDVGAVSGTASPVIVYVRLQGRSADYRYVIWKDGEWQDRHMCSTPLLRKRGSYPGGLTLDHRDPRVVYVSRKVGEYFQVEAWATADRGETWATKPLTRDSQADSFRPTATLGGSTVLWMTGQYAHYRRFDTRIVVSEAREKARERRARERKRREGNR